MPDPSGRPDQRHHGPADQRGPIEQLVDLAVFAPIGLLMSLDEVVPQLVEKAHQHVQVARFFGRMAVRTGTEEARRRFGQARPRRSPGDGGTARVVPLHAVPAPGPDAAAPHGDAVVPSPPAAPAAPAEPPPPAAALGIPDYDVLSASQVVPRLPGLSADELDAVRRYEAAHRGRKTILAKIAQLQA
jgi:hypothetical protein